MLSKLNSTFQSEERKKQIDIICRHISNNLRKRRNEEETTKMAKIQRIFGMQHGKYITKLVTEFCKVFWLFGDLIYIFGECYIKSIFKSFFNSK